MTETLTASFLATFTNAERLTNSTDGNPRWRVTFIHEGNTRTMDTADDHYVGYKLLQWMGASDVLGDSFRFHYVVNGPARITKMDVVES